MRLVREAGPPPKGSARGTKWLLLCPSSGEVWASALLPPRGSKILSLQKNSPNLVGRRADKSGATFSGLWTTVCGPLGEGTIPRHLPQQPSFGNSPDKPTHPTPGDQTGGILPPEKPQSKVAPKAEVTPKAGLPAKQPPRLQRSTNRKPAEASTDGAHLSPRLVAPPRAAGRRSTHAALRPSAPPGTRAPVYNGPSETQPPDPLYRGATTSSRAF